MSSLRKLLIGFIAATIKCRACAFAPRHSPSIHSSSRGGGGGPSPPRPRRRSSSSPSRARPAAPLRAAPPPDGGDAREEDPARCWNPDLRRQLAAVSALGLLETTYLTYDKLAPDGGTAALVGALCSSAGSAASCADVLHGPYASLPLGAVDVPLAAVGAAGYALVLALAAVPLLRPPAATAVGADGDGDAAADGNNRVALLGATTLMASFSAYLVSLLVGVLHAACPFCLASAGLSVALAALAWSGGALPGAGGAAAAGTAPAPPALRTRGLAAGASSVGLATVAALGLFLNAADAGAGAPAAAAPGAPPASAARFAENVPPRVTAASSPAALALAADLRALDARMFGAFWCSHCYDQKQELGREAMRAVPYVECDREGYENRRELCVARKLPGYPTWEIGGELFPGEKSLEELREIVDGVKLGVKPGS